MYTMPFGHMDGSMHEHRSELDYRGFDEHTLEMLVTTALKMRRGWRYVELMESSSRMTVFADPSAITVVSAGPGMHLILDVFFSAPWMSFAMS